MLSTFGVMTSIRSKLLLWLMIPLAIVAAIVGIETFLSSQKTSNDLHDKTLLAAALAISENVINSNGTLLAGDTLAVLTENLGDRYFYHVVGPGNSFVTGYSGYPRLPATVKLRKGRPYFYDSIHLGNPVRVVAMQQSFFDFDRDLNGLTTITTWQRITQRKNLALSLFGKSLLRMVLLIFLAGAIVWFAVAHGLKPIANLQRAINQRSPHDLTPIKRSMPIELSGIVKSMNHLFNRVAQSKKNRERFIGDAAHQLKNPIAALKVQAETALFSTKNKSAHSHLRKIVDTTNQTSRLIEQMLTNANVNAIDSSSFESIDLANITGDATRMLAAKALQKNQDISFEIKLETSTVFGHKILLQEAIANLIDNAIDHTDEGSTIKIILECSKHTKNLLVHIYDTGTAILENDFLKLTQPFATGDQPSSGSGLGLSIAKEVAKLHGGALSTAPTESGKRITLELKV